MPGKSVQWTIHRGKLTLRTLIKKGYTIEPDIDLAKLGNFERWRITPTDGDVLELNCTWDARLVQDVMFQTVNNILKSDSCDESAQSRTTLKENISDNING